MKLVILAVRDRATDQFGTPMFLVSKGQGIRSFGDEVNRAERDNAIYTHPDDYDLYELGTWDSDTGSFETSAPKQVALGKDLVIKK